MKMKTKKLLELLKSGLVLFGISLVLWNCTSNDTITIEEKLQVFEPIEASEAQSIISNIIEEQKLRRAKTSLIKIDHSSLNFIEVNNTNISIPTFSATWNEKIKTKAFLVKKNGIAYPCLYHLVPFKDEKLTNNLFSGGIIITTIENEFINGYKVEEGIINAKYIRKDNSSSESSRKADDSEFNCSGAAWCDSLNEVIIHSSDGGGSSSGSGSININTSNPVSSQGWMISLSGNNVSGGAGGGSSSPNSNSGNGGESSGSLLSLFNCDNPTPNGCENDQEEEVPPSCKSFNYKQIGSTNLQASGVKDVTFRIRYKDPYGNWNNRDFLFQTIYFTTPRFSEANGGNLTNGRGAELTADALQHAHRRAVAYFLATNGTESQVRTKLWEYIRDEMYNGIVRGGSASFTPPLGFTGTITRYRTSAWFNDDCD